MSRLIEILNFEEGYRENPYLDTRGYPTVAGGIKIGPQNAPLSYYQFTVPRVVGDVWKKTMVNAKTAEMSRQPAILAALAKCNEARADVLYSMAYQLGVTGLAGFKKTLALAAAGNFVGAAAGMLDSLWAKQTPNRAVRHASVMRSGDYSAYEGLL